MCVYGVYVGICMHVYVRVYVHACACVSVCMYAYNE